MAHGRGHSRCVGCTKKSRSQRRRGRHRYYPDRYLCFGVPSPRRERAQRQQGGRQARYLPTQHEQRDRAPAASDGRSAHHQTSQRNGTDGVRRGARRYRRSLSRSVARTGRASRDVRSRDIHPHLRAARSGLRHGNGPASAHEAREKGSSRRLNHLRAARSSYHSGNAGGGNRRFRDHIDLEEFAAAPHAALTFGDSHSPYLIERVTDDLLSGEGLSRFKAVQVSSVLALPAIVAESDLIAVIPADLAERAARTYPIKIFPLPLERVAPQHMIVWHSRSISDPGSQWLRNLIRGSQNDAAKGSKPNPN